MTTSTALFSRSADDLSRAFADKSLSPVEVAQSCLSRMDAWEPQINAMYLVKREAALASALAAEKRWTKGEALGPLDGVPITIKENIYTKGDPAPIGTKAMDLTPKGDDAPASARAREAGLVLLGKTTMPDFGMLSSGMSSFHGVTRNPWRVDRNTSGSSSGAGAAAAAGYGPLHIGTDIGGSVRLPATHCGIFALKPSFGRIPVNPPYLGRVAGPMTRSVRDSAHLLAVLARPDARDFMSLPYQPEDYAGKLEQFSVKGKRVGLMMNVAKEGVIGLSVDPLIVAAVQAAAMALEGAGAIIEPIAGFLTQSMMDGMGRFFEARTCNDIAAMDATTRSKVLPYLVEWATWRAQTFTGAAVMADYTQVMMMREAATQTVARYDFVLSPTSPVLPFDAEIAGPGNDPRHAFPHIQYTVAYNMSEHPAASINWTAAGPGTHEGLPIGVQLIGQRFDDLGVLQVCRVLEQLRPVQRLWPEPKQA
jgi:aspartyl-tRNA(Asn)/glutamyl-tRNA(Gln) amidotransferase subunit A